MRSLLSKMLSRLLTCMIVVFVLAIPLFYVLTKHFYAEDMLEIVTSVQQGNGIPPLDLEEDIIEGLVLQLVLIFIMVGVSIYITLRFVTRRLWQPFDDTLTKADNFNLSQDDVPHFADTDVVEFDRLNRRMGELMAKNKKIYRAQKEFTENASHELQTPIAVIRSKLDLLMQEELGERQLQLVSDLYRMCKRMEKVNRNLLLLAKIDNGQYIGDREVDVAVLLADMMANCGAMSGQVEVKIDDRRCPPRRTVKANPMLMECLLKNLIANAVRHSPPHTAVEVVLEDRRLTVSNPSADGRPLQAATLFRRFGSGSAQRSGNGLGLAIVKAICDLHHWTVRYEFVAGHHCFEVSC